eukprot:CAMPEP_0175634842 /NCGR_PEP_ID=MMETSP0097-20121207/1386_1 /TAXON_ID=311494 /ORGANISM="Alexandrium monilatum, Strain CCMP3105" /LENGTH=141 /DNA_ID=CAMNT_0016940465 /DNA_START=430 /DNA_END=851 /DNA_ORIENTATION=-
MPLSPSSSLPDAGVSPSNSLSAWLSFEQVALALSGERSRSLSRPSIRSKNDELEFSDAWTEELLTDGRDDLSLRCEPGSAGMEMCRKVCFCVNLNPAMSRPDCPIEPAPPLEVEEPNAPANPPLPQAWSAIPRGTGQSASA